MDKYPCTLYEDELLTILVEECAEVIKAATKLMRFGKENNPMTGISNLRDLALEIGDLQHMIFKVTEVGLVRKREMDEGFARKGVRLAQHMQHKR